MSDLILWGTWDQAAALRAVQMEQKEDMDTPEVCTSLFWLATLLCHPSVPR